MKMKSMKVGLLLLAAQLSGGLLTAAESGQPVVVPKVDVSVESDLKVLAEGFMAAFAEIPVGARYIWIRNGSETMVLGSVASVKAYGGVLVIQIESGPMHVISAGDVLRITNENPPRTKK